MRSMIKTVNYSEKQIQIALFAKAMSHPARVFILEKLSKMNSCCYSGDIAEELNIGRSALSLHLKELKHAGLIQGTTEPPYIKYCINRENWQIAKILCKELFEE
jgi:ArsR family transcriptional regulator